MAERAPRLYFSRETNLASEREAFPASVVFKHVLIYLNQFSGKVSAKAVGSSFGESAFAHTKLGQVSSAGCGEFACGQVDSTISL
jgi:hypothetical protein